MNEFTSKAVKTTCPYCGVGCGILATPKSDGAVEIKGDPYHPANFGKLCSKGSSLGQTIGLEGRLLSPVIKGKDASWDDALDLVANKFSETIEKYGPDAVAFYVSGQILTEDYYVANKLMKGFMGSANIDTNSRLCMASSVAGHKKSFGTDTVPGTYEDLELADLIVLVGSNLAWCHPVLYQRIEAAKQTRPEMKIVVIDPRQTMTANIADMFLGINPDGDVAFFSGLLTYLSQHGVLDTEYIENYTNGFEAAIRNAAEFSMDDILEQTGIPLETLNTFFKLFADSEKTVTVYSQGVNQSVCGTDKVSSIINCHLATGRIGRPGMGPFSVTGQPNAMGGREVGGLANMLACHMDIENETHRNRVQNFWQSPTIPTEQGLKAVDMFQAVGDGRIKAIWIMSTNPVDSMPEADKIREALEKCPFVVVSDILENTDTIAYADVKLPAAGWGEKSGTVTNSDRRISRQRQFLEMPSKVKPDWWQLAEVGKRMGYIEAFDYPTPHAIFDEYAKLSSHENDDKRDFDIGALADLSLAEYDSLEPFQWPQKHKISNSETRFFATGDFYTPDRKARFIKVSPQIEKVTSKDYPFVLNTGRIRDHWHTMTRTALATRLSSHIAEPFCEIHPTDASNLKIKPASLVEVESPHGEIIVRALITERVQMNSIFVPMHWTDQYASNARIDKLVPSRVDPFSAQPASKNVAVKIIPADITCYGFLVSREKPILNDPAILYWALAKCENGWRTELAFASRETGNTYATKLIENIPNSETLWYEDAHAKEIRFAAFDNTKCLSALYMSSEPVLLSREWLIEKVIEEHLSKAQRYHVLAGRPSAATPDKGPIICSCMNVGSKEIYAAVQAGNHTAQKVGEVTTAGTNCGSCRAEINGMINDTLDQNQIAAE